MKKKGKQKKTQEVKIKVRQKASILSIIKFILGIAFIALIVFFLLGILSSCDSRIKVPWSGWFNNPFGIFETDNENPDLPPDEEGDGDGEITQFTVTFYAYEDNVTYVAVAEGGTVGDKMPPNPVQDGFTFDGWRLDGMEFTKDTVVNSDLIVVAHWVPVLCDHSYVLKPDTIGGEDAYGHTLTVYQCTKCGEDLTWVNHVYYLDPEYSGDETDEYGHPLILYVCSLCGEGFTQVLHDYVDGVCTICEEEQCVHEFVDGVCTKCGAFEQEFNDEPKPDEPDEPDDKPCDEHIDENDDGICDNCGAVLSPDEPDEPCDEHIDENDDGKCDICGEDMSGDPEPPHVHTFSEEWTSDERGHWHAATCGHDAMSGFAPHDFVSGVCSVCGYVAPHEHTFSEEWTSDASGHWHAATCGHDVTGSFAAHKWDGGEVVKEPTCTTEGERLYTCTVCGYERRESIATTAHDLSYTYDENGHWQKCANCSYTTSSELHNFVGETCTVCGYVAPHEHTFSEEWTSDASGHWHAATCGHDATSGFAAHKWNGGEVVKEPTCTTEGERLYTCTVCGYERRESIATTAHDLSYTYDENGHWQKCANCSYTTSSELHNFVGETCTVCGYVAPHEHTFSEEWTSDASGHWHAATCGHDATSGFAAHKWNGGEVVKEPTCTTEGERLYTCTVCGYERRESIATAHDLSYYFDENGHWQECSKCDYTTSSVSHNFEYGECAVCGFENPCKDHVDEDFDGNCDNCDEWLLDSPYDSYDGVSAGGYLYDDFFDSFGFNGDPQGGYPYSYTYPENSRVAFTESVTGNDLIVDYKVIFAFTSGVLGHFEEIGVCSSDDGNGVVEISGNSVMFEFDMYGMLFEDYFGFSDATLTLRGVSGVEFSYTVEDAYGSRIQGQIDLPSEFWSETIYESSIVCTIYMGMNMSIAESEGLIVFDGPEEIANLDDITMFLRGPNVRGEMLLYVCLPGGFAIGGVRVAGSDPMNTIGSRYVPYAYFIFVANDPWESVVVNYDYYEPDDVGGYYSFNYTVWDIEGIEQAEDDLGIVCTVVYVEGTDKIRIYFYTLPDYRGGNHFSDVKIYCSQGDSLVTVDGMWFADNYHESGYITLSCDYVGLCDFMIEFV